MLSVTGALTRSLARARIATVTRITQWRPEPSAARVGLWSLVAAVLIDAIAHPHYWGWWAGVYGAHASAWENGLAFLGLIAAAFDLYDMLTLDTVVIPGGHNLTYWFPSLEIRRALRVGLAANFEDGYQLVSPETYEKLVREELDLARQTTAA